MKGDRQCTYPEARLDRTSTDHQQRNDAEILQQSGTVPTSVSESGESQQVRTETFGASLDPSESNSSAYENSDPDLGPERFFLNNTSFASAWIDNSKWNHLAEDIRFYLLYHERKVNFHHYLFKAESDSFLHTFLLEQAALYEPLLYGVVGFAAFQFTVSQHGGEVGKFFAYYNRSITLLRESLARGDQCCDATLLTALQLATFEVCDVSFNQAWVQILRTLVGVSRRLGLSLAAPASSIPYHPGAIYSHRYGGNRLWKEDARLVLSI